MLQAAVADCVQRSLLGGVCVPMSPSPDALPQLPQWSAPPSAAPSDSVYVQTPLLPVTAPPDYVTSIGAASEPSVKSAQLSAIRVPSSNR